MPEQRPPGCERDVPSRASTGPHRPSEEPASVHALIIAGLTKCFIRLLVWQRRILVVYYNRRRLALVIVPRQWRRLSCAVLLVEHVLASKLPEKAVTILSGDIRARRARGSCTRCSSRSGGAVPSEVKVVHR